MELKKYFNYSLLALAATFVFASCDDLEDIIPDEDVDPKEYTVSFDLTDSENGNATVIASQVDSTEFTAFVKFTTTGDDMKRVYMTLNNNGAGDEPYELSSSNLDKKGDGSIDLSGDFKETFTFILPFPLLSSGTGTYEYKIWATSGKGDYRDMDKNFAVGIGTIVVDYESENPTTVVKEYSAKLLAAPLNDLTSESFVSLLDGQLYEIADGEEFSAFWDFGYFYGADDASLASTSAYTVAFGSTSAGVPFIDVEAIAGTSELNNCYFALSTLTSAEFEAITNSSELSSIATPSSQSINNLAVGDVIEFEDAYGKKGLIEVDEIYLGANENGYDSDAYMTINIKVQP